jgi:uncharacterized protein YggE
MATVTLGAQVDAGTAAEAQALAGERMRGVLAAHAAAGMATADVTTDRVSLEPTFDYTGTAPVATGYQAVQTVHARIRDLATLGGIVDAAVTAGANQVAEVSLGIADPGAARDEARTRAMADARRSAETLAGAAGVRLGSPIAIAEEDDRHAPGPMRMKLAEAAMSDGTPIAAGRTTLEVRVTVTYALLG